MSGEVPKIGQYNYRLQRAWWGYRRLVEINWSRVRL